MISRAKKRAQRIREQVPMAQLLSDYGYNVIGDAGDREQQFSCDLHGDGQDGTPSARYYPESNSAYCFGCGRTRDAITWMMEKEGLQFGDACAKIERKFRLPALPWEDEEEQTMPDYSKEVPASFQDEDKRVLRTLSILNIERGLPMQLTLRLWEAFDRIRHGVKHEEWSDDRGRQEMSALRQRISLAQHAAHGEPS